MPRRLLSLLLLVLAGVLTAAEPQPAPPLRATRWYNAEPTTMEKLRGNVVLLDFWATWCLPCIEATPKVNALASAFEGKPVRVIMVHSATTFSRDERGLTREIPAEQVLPAFLKKHEISLPVAVASRADLPTWGVGGIPHYVVLDRGGRIRYSERAALPSEQLIRELLAEGDRDQAR